MRYFQTLIWMAITAIVVAFITMNWNPVAVRFWPVAGGDYLQFDWPVGVIALVFFLMGLLPMWLLSKASKWRMNRRIAALESAARFPQPSASLSSTSLAAADPEIPAIRPD